MANHKRKSTLQTLLSRGKREQATTTETPAPAKPQLLGIELSNTTVELTPEPHPLHATFTVEANGHTIARVKASYRHSDNDHFIRFTVTASPNATNRQGTTDFHAIANLEDGQQAGTYHPVVIIIDYEDGKSVWLEGEDLTHCAHPIRVKGTGAQTSAPHIGELNVTHSSEHGPCTYLVKALIDTHDDGLESLDLTFSAPTSSDTVDVQLAPASEGHYVGLLTITQGESGIWPLHHLVARGLSGESWDWTRGASPPVYALMQAGINVDALAAGEAPTLLHDDIFVPTPIEDDSATPQPVEIDAHPDSATPVERGDHPTDTTATNDDPETPQPHTNPAPELVDHSTNYSLGDYVNDEPREHIVEYSAEPDESDTANIGPISTKMRTVDTAQTPTVTTHHETDSLTTKMVDEPTEETTPSDLEAAPDEPQASTDDTESPTTEDSQQEDTTAEALATPAVDTDAETTTTHEGDTHSPSEETAESDTPSAPQQATATHDTFSEYAPSDNPDAHESPWQEDETEQNHGLHPDVDDPWEGEPREVENKDTTLYDDPWENDNTPTEEPRSTLYDDPWEGEREPLKDDVIDIRDGKVGTSRRGSNHSSLPNLPDETKIVW